MIALEVGTSGILHISTFTLLIKELHYHKTHHKNLNEMVEKYYCIRKTSLAVGNLNHKILLNSEKNWPEAYENVFGCIENWMNDLEPLFQKQGLQDYQDLDKLFVQYIND